MTTFVESLYREEIIRHNQTLTRLSTRWKSLPCRKAITAQRSGQWLRSTKN